MHVVSLKSRFVLRVFSSTPISSFPMVGIWKTCHGSLWSWFARIGKVGYWLSGWRYTGRQRDSLIEENIWPDHTHRVYYNSVCTICQFYRVVLTEQCQPILLDFYRTQASYVWDFPFTYFYIRHFQPERSFCSYSAWVFVVLPEVPLFKMEMVGVFSLYIQLLT